MSNALSAEAFMPCLLDRLTDDEPEKTKESHYHLSLTLLHYRRSVLRDLRWLLNAPAHRDDDGLEDFPEVQHSVLNFGTPDLSGRTASSLNPVELERQLVECIRQYEPRIMSQSLAVKVIPGVNQASPNVIGFEIRGTMWANPMPERFLVETLLDLETGECVF